MMPHSGDPVEPRLDADELEAFTAAVCRALGTPDDIAADVAVVLVAADRRGIPSHGTARLPSYVALVDAGVMDPRARPSIDGGRGAFVRFDAGNGWGHHAGRVAIDWAIHTAGTTGIALASSHNANHYGIAGWYALRAASSGMIGMSMTNTTGVVAPTRSSAGLIGTNPIAIAAPAGHRPPFSLDMATSTVPRGRIEVAERRGTPIPLGWALGPDGLPTTDASEALEGTLTPLGGGEETAGYKGYGLALAVDVLTGVLAGATFGKRIAGLFDTLAPSDLGQLFLVIDPGAIGDAEAFGARLGDYLDGLTQAPTAPDALGPVLVPGDPEVAAEAVSRVDGVATDTQHLLSLAALARRFGLEPPPLTTGSRT
jgi:LDH2 family malate/lactate/ureidoglycolate dehydrogenase